MKRSRSRSPRLALAGSASRRPRYPSRPPRRPLRPPLHRAGGGAPAPRSEPEPSGIPVLRGGEGRDGTGHRRANGPFPADIVKILISLGDMATATQSLSDDAIGVVARARLRGRDRRHRGGRGRRGGAGRRQRAGSTRPRRHHHGPRRPWEDAAPGRDPQVRRRLAGVPGHHPAHRRVPGPRRRPRGDVHRHPGPRSVHGDAGARCTE